MDESAFVVGCAEECCQVGLVFFEADNAEPQTAKGEFAAKEVAQHSKDQPEFVACGAGDINGKRACCQVAGKLSGFGAYKENGVVEGGRKLARL